MNPLFENLGKKSLWLPVLLVLALLIVLVNAYLLVDAFFRVADLDRIEQQSNIGKKADDDY